MRTKLLIVLRKAPYTTIHAAEALRHAHGAMNSKISVNLILVDEGVWLARKGHDCADSGWTNLSLELGKLVAAGDMLEKRSAEHSLNVHVHSESLMVRGMEPGALLPGVETVGDDGLAAMLRESRNLMLF